MADKLLIAAGSNSYYYSSRNRQRKRVLNVETTRPRQGAATTAASFQGCLLLRAWKKRLFLLTTTLWQVMFLLLWPPVCLCSSLLCHAWSPSIASRLNSPVSSRQHQDMFFHGSRTFEKAVIPRMSLERAGGSNINSNSDLSSTGDSSVAQPFGRQDYWESFYRNQQDDFSWYSAWQDIEPFLLEWIVAPNPLLSSSSSSPSRADGTKDYYNILLPGIGSDVSLVENLYHAGFQNLYAFDYAQESIDYCRQRMKNITTTIDFRTADARDLTCYNSNKNELLQDEEEEEPFYFDAVIDKGTLDAIFLSGTTSVERIQNLKLAIQEMQRLLRPSTGIFWSLSGICTQQLVKNNNNDSSSSSSSSSSSLDDDDHNVWKDWQVCADSSSELYTTRDGYTSNNLDGTLLVWRKPAAAAAAAAAYK